MPAKDACYVLVRTSTEAFDLYERIRDAYRLAVPDTAAATALIVKYPALFRDYEITKGKMDDVFLAVTGKKLTGGNEK